LTECIVFDEGTMRINEFQDLLARAEGETLDFKVAGYDLTSPAGRNSFTLDLLAMANTPRDTAAHIVLGVKWTPEHGASVVGLQRQFDDVEFQDAIGEGRVSPHPRFAYCPLQFDGKQVGVIQVLSDNRGPYS
jgi:predicted HTH transcriptional regulator